MTTYTFTPHNCEDGTCNVGWMAGDEARKWVKNLVGKETIEAFAHTITECEWGDERWGPSILWKTEQGFIVGINFKRSAWGDARLRGNQFEICEALPSDEERIALFDALVEHMKATLEA